VVLDLGVAEAASLAVGDMDGDGWLDLVLGYVGACCPRREGGVAVAFGSGEGIFDRIWRSPLDRFHPSLFLTDIDRDGDLDLLAAGEGPGEPNHITILHNAGDGSLHELVNVPLESGPSQVLVNDLNGDGRLDVAVAHRGSCDIAILLNEADGSELCASKFRRGDMDADGTWNLSDALWLLRSLFQGGGSPACHKAADADDDGRVQINDAMYLLNYFVRGGSPPPPPWQRCGRDPTPDGLECKLYPRCR
jgi:hypothetical protein